MKKLLILLICGFAFTQSIQTKQVEVTINDWGQINLYELIENPIEGKYKTELTNIIINGSIDSDWYPAEIQMIGDEEMINSYNSMTAGAYANFKLLIISSILAYPINEVTFYLDDNNQSLSFDDVNNFEYILLTENSSITLTFWVTGMFEDEGIGLQGDMNGDEMLNVVDVVSLVSVILGE
jgi:hypothetical protein